MAEPDSYVSLGKNQFFDLKRKIVIEKIGSKEKVVGFDRRRSAKLVLQNRRKSILEHDPDWIVLEKNLFFHKVERTLMKRINGKMVLFSRDRRSVAERRKEAAAAVPQEKRKVHRRGI